MVGPYETWFRSRIGENNGANTLIVTQHIDRLENTVCFRDFDDDRCVFVTKTDYLSGTFSKRRKNGVIAFPIERTGWGRGVRYGTRRAKTKRTFHIGCERIRFARLRSAATNTKNEYTIMIYELEGSA